MAGDVVAAAVVIVVSTDVDAKCPSSEYMDMLLLTLLKLLKLLKLWLLSMLSTELAGIGAAEMTGWQRRSSIALWFEIFIFQSLLYLMTMTPSHCTKQ